MGVMGALPLIYYPLLQYSNTPFRGISGLQEKNAGADNELNGDRRFEWRKPWAISISNMISMTTSAWSP